ncbi:fungal-specific transcription factor domain-containing protein [Lipomyces kononenkoae]
MDSKRKRQKVSSACERCHKRKLGCDTLRPCQLCVRASAPCVSRGGSISRVEALIQSGEHEPTSRSKNDDTAVLPELGIVDLSTRMFSGKHRIDMDYDTSALPGGKKPSNTLSSKSIQWRDIFGLSLPSKTSLDMLVEVFFQSVDWFMMVFHEESFRLRYEGLMASIHMPTTEDSNLLWLVLLVLSMGAHYLSLTVSAPEEKLDLQLLSRSLLAGIENRFLSIIGSPSEEAVQICVLMGSFHLFNGRPAVGLGVLGSGIKIAQVIRLHRDSIQPGASESGLESRRRTWLALEVFDKYAAIAFGRPCGIDDSDCNVNTVADIRTGVETPHRQASQLDYHRWRIKLYRIVGPFLGRRLQTNRLESVNRIHSQLSSWQSQLPERLRLETYKGEEVSESPPLLQMQALMLQLTYDNIQIILHRSVAFGSGNNGSFWDGLATTPSGSAFSRQQLLQSALRTSDLHSYRSLLQACRRTHAVMHVGICLFTAGVVLCALALSERLSVTSEKAKTGIAHILRLLQDSVLGENLLSAQSAKILEDLVAVVMQSEQQFILGRRGKDVSASTSRSDTAGIWTRGNSMVPSIPAIPEDPSSSHRGESLHSRASQEDDDVDISQEDFAQPAVSYTTSTNELDNASVDDNGQVSIELNDGLLSVNSITGFIWNGNVPSLADASLTDASQLWLWSNNPDFQSFADSA